MVVLAASICTRGGKPVLSRQFRDMPRSRIEALLAAFPKLTDSNTQHTTVEIDSVRYVYQPLDELYMVLITNRQSNILQDIDSLHLFAQVVSSICRSLDEREILRHAFELLSAFDEVVSLGYRENLSLGQIKTFLEMESHEERIQEIIARNKEFEANEERKRKSKQLEVQRKEMQRNSRSLGGMGGGMGSGGMGGGTPTSSRFPSYSAPTPAKAPVTSSYDSYEQEKKKTFAAPKGKGMQLGRKKNAGAYEKIRDTLGEQHEENAPLISSSAPTGAPAIASPRASISHDGQPIHVVVKESLVAELSRDGTVKSFEIKGDLTLRVTDPSLGKINLGLSTDNPEGINFRTHPNVDKIKFNGERRVQPRDNRSFPTNGQFLEVLRWRHAPKGEVDISDLPISFTVWFNRGSNEDYSMTVEYELQDTSVELRDVTVSIPFGRSEPRVTSDDEVYEVNGDSLDWTIPRISADNANGSFEFEGQTDDESEFFPIGVHFTKEALSVNVEVNEVNLVEENEPVDFSKDTKSLGEFTIQ